MKYRSDIDGLRAIAVLTVVLFHGEITAVSGGFIGVDVFFVISGYLITGIIAREMQEDRFSLVGFYVRRARRILPALFVMMAIVAVLASAVLIPSVYERFAESAAAAAVSLSNVFFYKSTGYFGGEPYQLPLLHTWSLGVEEQFYIFFPVYLIVARRLFRRMPFWVLILPVAVVSFAIGMVQIRTNPTAAFFLPFARMWELALGGLLAVGFVPAVRSKAAAQVFAAGGLLLILLAATRFDQTLPFPGENALVPVVGAALILHAGESFQTVVARFLSLRPMVFVGLISYSLYLWHWPILVLTRAATGSNPTGIWRVLQFAFILGVSTLSWRFVERPFRRSVRFKPRKVVFAMSAAGMAAFLAFGFVVVSGNGLPQRLPSGARLYADGTADTNPYRGACDAPAPLRIQQGDVCVVGTKGEAPSVALIGDSFADAIVPGVEAAAADAGKSAALLTQEGCTPLVDVTSLSQTCRDHVAASIDYVRRTPSIKSVLLVARWSTIVEGNRMGAVQVPNVYLHDAKSTTTGSAENKRVVARELPNTVAAFGDGVKVYVAAYLPEQLTFVPQTATSSVVLHRALPPGVTRAVYDARQRNVRDILTTPLPDGSTYNVLDGGMLCGPTHCPVVEGGRDLYVDDNHLSRTGAVRARDLFAPAFRS